MKDAEIWPFPEKWIFKPLSGYNVCAMSQVIDQKTASAAIPDKAFDAMTDAQKRAWVRAYLADGQAQIARGDVVRLHSDADIDTLLETIRNQAHERSGIVPEGKG